MNCHGRKLHERLVNPSSRVKHVKICKNRFRVQVSGRINIQRPQGYYNISRRVLRQEELVGPEGAQTARERCLGSSSVV